MRPGSYSLNTLAATLERQLETKRDYVCRESKLRLTDKAHLELGDVSLPITPYAHGQIAAHLNIPRVYYERMLQQEPTLLASNVNTWLGKSSGRRLVRTLDGLARAYLSDRYRPIDNWDLLNVALPRIEQAGCQVVSAEITETRLYVKAVTDRISGEVRKGDVVRAGIVISNSEVGAGSVRVEPLVERLVCSNGLIMADAAVRRYHIGQVLGGIGDFYKHDTIAADNRAFALKVRDAIDAVFIADNFQRALSRMRDAANTVEIDDAQQAVVEISDSYKLSDAEGASILKYLARGGDMTQWGMVNAVTRAAQDVEDYDRSTELERLGGELLELPVERWEKIAAAS